MRIHAEARGCRVPLGWKRAGLVAALLASLACRTVEDRSGLQRRPLSPVAQNGWVRLPLDAEAQRHLEGLWLGDAQGRSVPFLMEREALWEPRQLELKGLLLGRDTSGRPTAEFSLKYPEGWQLREREHLRLDLDMEGSASWVCAVKVERRGEGGPISLEGSTPLQVFQLEGGQESHSISIPWDARSYRITLQSAYGKAPALRGVVVTARTEPDGSEGEWMQPARLQRNPKDGAWRLKLPAPERVVGLELKMAPPLAPVHPGVSLPPLGDRELPEHDRDTRIHCEGLVWNLPALGTRSEWVELNPILTDELELGFPEGAQLESARIRIRREALLFPAEAGATYYLHLGGEARRAPGDLGVLPDSSRSLYQRKPLSLGPGEADPQGLPRPGARADQAAERSRRWLPWFAGVVVALLALIGARLLRRP